jgi:hypothetical protein
MRFPQQWMLGHGFLEWAPGSEVRYEHWEEHAPSCSSETTVCIYQTIRHQNREDRRLLPQMRNTSFTCSTKGTLEPQQRGGRRRVRSSSPSRVKNFLFSMSSRPVLGPIQPPILWVPGTLPPDVERTGREADHSPPTSAEVKKMWIYTSTHPYAFMA